MPAHAATKTEYSSAVRVNIRTHENAAICYSVVSAAPPPSPSPRISGGNLGGKATGACVPRDVYVT